MTNYDIRLTSNHKSGTIMEIEALLLTGEYEYADIWHRSYSCMERNFYKAGAICMKDELVKILTDRTHDRIEMRKAHWIAGTASVYVTYAIQVEKE